MIRSAKYLPGAAGPWSPPGGEPDEVPDQTGAWHVREDKVATACNIKGRLG